VRTSRCEFKSKMGCVVKVTLKEFRNQRIRLRGGAVWVRPCKWDAQGLEDKLVCGYACAAKLRNLYCVMFALAVVGRGGVSLGLHPAAAAASTEAMQTVTTWRAHTCPAVVCLFLQLEDVEVSGSHYIRLLLLTPSCPTAPASYAHTCSPVLLPCSWRTLRSAAQTTSGRCCWATSGGPGRAWTRARSGRTTTAWGHANTCRCV
jgi:hypothetical protein